jgi:hypothetical protein
MWLKCVLLFLCILILKKKSNLIRSFVLLVHSFSIICFQDSTSKQWTFSNNFNFEIQIHIFSTETDSITNGIIYTEPELSSSNLTSCPVRSSLYGIRYRTHLSCNVSVRLFATVQNQFMLLSCTSWSKEFRATFSERSTNLPARGDGMET